MKSEEDKNLSTNFDGHSMAMLAASLADDEDFVVFPDPPLWKPSKELIELLLVNKR